MSQPAQPLPQKIFSDDKNVPYKSSNLTPKQSKDEIEGVLAKYGYEIEGVLAKYGIKDTAWRWDPEGGKVFVGFTVPEKFGGIFVKVEAPQVWKRASAGGRGHGAPKTVEEIDWRVSMRLMYWYIKNELAMAYVWQIDRAAAFLPFVRDRADVPLHKIMMDRLERGLDLPALPDPQEKPGPRRINP